jgi:hypothetical protein
VNKAMNWEIKDIISLLVGLAALVLCLRFIYRRITRPQFFLTLAVVFLIDADHFFLTEQTGFMRVPEAGQSIFQLFHTVEFLFFVLLINLPFTQFAGAGKNWLFPRREEFQQKWRYYYLLTVRAFIFGTLAHYLFDIFIYSIGGKLGYYDFSVIHHFLVH